jgi:ABC-type transporter Mla maintaining outer membrane lipid asymmetry ATPase subunit MlaF
MSNVTPKLELKGVKKSFGPKKVLQGIDLAVPPENLW